MTAQEISQILNSTGEDRERYFDAITPPVIQTSNFAFSTVDELRGAFQDEASTYLYSRATNPTVEILSRKLAALDGAEKSLVFNSGAGAIFTAVLANVKSGDHIISVDKPYTWAQKMFDHVLTRFNITTTYVDGRDIKNFENAIRDNTSVIYLETPNSWSFYLQDLSAVATLARARKIVTICDNSYCTPLYQRPLDLGIDLSLQSATKYLNGHSDVIAGVLSGSKEMMNKIFDSEYMNMGIGTTPFNAWLIIRGLRTLPVRMERSSRSAKTVISYLKKRDEIEEVLYPLDEGSPQYELAKKQMKGAGGLLSFYLKADDWQQIEAFCDSLQYISMAVSWGGYESLIIPGIASVSREDFDPENPHHRSIRMYIGLEDVGFLIEDLERGFSALRNASSTTEKSSA